MKDLNNITVGTMLKKINMELELNGKNVDFKKVDFNLLVTLLNRLGYTNDFYNEDYEFEFLYDPSKFSILINDDATFYNIHFIINFGYAVIKIYRDDYADFLNTTYNNMSFDIFVKNINKYLLEYKIKNLHFTKLDFIRLFSLLEKNLKEHNLKINCYIIEVSGKCSLKYDSIESLENTDFDFRNLVIGNLK